MSSLITTKELNDTSKIKFTTLRTITKFELAMIIALRTSQLQNGCDPLVDITKLKDEDGNVNEQDIAELELMEKKIPMYIIRTLPNGKEERIPVSELSIGK